MIGHLVEVAEVVEVSQEVITQEDLAKGIKMREMVNNKSQDQMTIIITTKLVNIIEKIDQEIMIEDQNFKIDNLVIQELVQKIDQKKEVVLVKVIGVNKMKIMKKNQQTKKNQKITMKIITKKVKIIMMKKTLN